MHLFCARALRLLALLTIWWAVTSTTSAQTAGNSQQGVVVVSDSQGTTAPQGVSPTSPEGMLRIRAPQPPATRQTSPASVRYPAPPRRGSSAMFTEPSAESSTAGALPPEQPLPAGGRLYEPVTPEMVATPQPPPGSAVRTTETPVGSTSPTVIIQPEPANGLSLRPDVHPVPAASATTDSHYGNPFPAQPDGVSADHLEPAATMTLGAPPPQTVEVATSPSGMLIVTPRGIIGEEEPLLGTAAEPTPSAQPEAITAPAAPETTVAAPEASTEAVATAPATSETSAPAATDIRPITFDGLELGVSTLDGVHQMWGEPRQSNPQGAYLQETYDVEPFPEVVVTFVDGVAAALVIRLDKPYPPEAVAAELELSDLDGVDVPDEYGTLLGRAYPERGAILSYAADVQPPRVSKVILQVIDAQPFVLRAEARLETDYTGTLADLDQALQLDDEHGRAHWLRAQVLARLGRSDDALVEADLAVRCEPQNASFRITRSEQLAAQGNFEEAVADAEQAITLAADRPAIHALAVLRLGDHLAAGPERDYTKAIEHHLKAIELAEPVAGNADIFVRRTARQVVLEANLAVAQDIAWGHWKSKTEVVPQWLTTAQKALQRAKLGEAEVGAPQHLELLMCRQALAAHVGLQGQLDPQSWVEALLEVGRHDIDECTDALRKRQLEWELGLGLYDALQIYHERQQPQAALEYGSLAASYLESGAAGRQEVPGDAWLLGRLFFRLGALHAVQLHDHAQAVTWFDRAVPLIEQPIPPSALGDVGRQGETLVSIAVSYWATGQHDRAIALTRAGADKMKQAADLGILPRESLEVPYKNLATMHRRLGDTAQADDFARLAAATTDTLQR